ncbi:unnamed protein product [Cuscuta europaea]|uniref:non-specific serine/threonine protein kinase n=1 Tax=Cuscuta europaea TaxID=41803 RepID=A0A9P0Z2T8_CUSEU|nr:unnamed protein product [Cuscuta europaea]
MRAYYSFALSCKSFLLSFPLFLTVFLPLTSWAVSDELHGESRQLLSFKNGLPNKDALHDWVSSANPCSFTGVTCTSGFTEISSIDLSNTILGADFSLVSSHLLTLQKLENLVLKNSNLTGSLTSASKAQCGVSLKLVDLAENAISGPVSDISSLAGCSSLKSLNLSKNLMEFPEKGASFAIGLRLLDLSYNKLSGKNIFSWLVPSDFADLEFLSLKGNKMHGDIPEMAFKNLTFLDLSANNFSSFFPSFQECSHLVHLDLGMNSFSGVVPESIGSCSALQLLDISNNNFSGSIPATISNCTSLNWISLSNNFLSGKIPASLGSLSNLAILKLGNNSISGNIPTELGDCMSLLWIDLNTNLLSGPIPAALSKQSGYIAESLLTGKRFGYIKNDGSEICHGAGNLLEFGGIRQDRLDRISTRHPCKFTRLYKGITQPNFNHNGSMIFLDLSYNNLQGGIPKELGSMYYLFILNLGHNDLSGPIPPELGSLKTLAILDVSHNSLTGLIPQSLTRLTFDEIDLSNNKLSGPIPQSAAFDTFADYRFANNSGLCGYPLQECGSGSSSRTNWNHKSHREQAAFIATLTIGILFSSLCIFCLIILALEMKKRRKKGEEETEGAVAARPATNANSGWKLTGFPEASSINLSTFEKPLITLTLADLIEATNGFHNDSLIGSGGFGDVYKAQLKDGSVVAVKKLIHISGQGDKEFTAEMETIGKIKHRNLVPLLGYCKVGEERLLVYEYMKYGSLEDVLRDRKKKKKESVKLNWAARRKIVIGAARGLAFLHHNCIPHIIHRDMKSSNVLVDDNFEARVSDFGMARLMSAMDTHLSVSTLAGTPGYVPPEYYQSFRCSTKGDVYSFGVVLLELLTGKRPTHSADFGDNNLVGWVKLQNKTQIREVFDQDLFKDDYYPSLENELVLYLRVASECLDDRPWKRPPMVEVMAKFKEIQAGLGVESLPAVAVNCDDLSEIEGIELSIRWTIKEGNEQSSNQA